MSDKIKTDDCVKAICGYWEKAIDEGRNLPIGKYHGEAFDLINPKYWKRVKKMGNPNEGFIRLFSNVVVDKERTRAGEEAVSMGRVDWSARIKWVMVVRATDDEVYDVWPGEMIDGEFQTRLSMPVDDEEAWQKVYGEDYKKFPTDEFGQPEPPTDSLIPGGAIHLNVDKELTCVRRSSKKYIKLMEATSGWRMQVLQEEDQAWRGIPVPVTGRRQGRGRADVPQGRRSVHRLGRGAVPRLRGRGQSIP